MKSNQKKLDWYEAELLACSYLSDQWYSVIERNYTIRWWELDIIVKKWEILTFVEVKLVNHVLDLHDYITPIKLKHLHHTIDFYLREHTHDGDIQLDVIFVRYGQIIDHIKNVSGGW